MASNMPVLASLAHRIRIASRLRGARERIVARVCQDVFPAPDAPRGRAEAAHHVDILAAALEGGRPAAFADCVVEACAMLAARGIPKAAVVGHFGRLAAAVVEELGADDAPAVAAMLEAGRRALELAPEGGQPPVRYRTERDAYLEAALAGNRRGALAVVERALREAPPTQVYPGVLQSAMVEVGRRWARGAITVAQEHQVTAITQYVLATAYAFLPRHDTPRGRAVVTGVPGEHHQLGAHLVADIFEAAGWSVRFLGSNIPIPDVVAAARDHAAHVVGLSATLLTSVPSTRLLVEALRQELDPCPRIILGGAAFRLMPELALELGADAYAPDLESALEVLSRYIPT